MNPSGNSIVRKINDRACREPSCTNTKLKGSSMSLCKQCKTVFYCSAVCQRKDWPCHKSWCKKQGAQLAREAAKAGRLPEDFEAWRLAMGPMLYTWLCVGALQVKRHPDNIQKKFALLTLRQRKEGVSNVLKSFEYESIEVFDRSELGRVTGGTSEAVDSLVQHVRECDDKVKSQGKAGAALVLTEIITPDGAERSLLRFSPVAIRMAELELEEDTEWERRTKIIINEGKNIKHIIAKQERRGMLETT
ncbi:hypothetical protein B0H11DRAFT_1969999 [Mycena galericulata]|nr:hypothetical protein B0H11DRAFT_1969999 [Mycena galericulata]